MRICNLGSVNVDLVFQVPHIVRPGETLASEHVRTFAGGKGANQSVALARAGANVCHAGAVGADGRWLIEKLATQGVDTSLLRVRENVRTGHAIIQVDRAGENAIVLDAGANHAIDRAQIDQTLERFDAGDVLLLQNEISEVAYAIKAGRRRGLKVCFNPAPMTDAVHTYPLEAVDVLIVNETEGRALADATDPESIAPALRRRCGGGRGEVVLTLGAQGALHLGETGFTRAEAERVDAVDTTAAGDTFIGYYLAGCAAGRAVDDALRQACCAGAICCTRPGAMDAIPARDQLAQA